MEPTGFAPCIMSGWSCSHEVAPRAHVRGLPLLESRHPTSMLKVGGLGDDIGQSWTWEQLCIMGFATGALDAVSFPALGIFLSNQTGNTVFLFIAAFGLSTDGSTRLGDTATSLGSFLLFLCISGQAGNIIGRRRRWWLLATNTIQTFVILLIAILEVAHGVHNERPSRFATIVLLSAGSGMQVASAKTLSVPEVPTAMLTSPYADLLTDRSLFKRGRSGPRDKRLTYIFCFCAGTAIGGAMYRYSGTAAPIFLAGGVKLCVTVSYLFNPSKQQSPLSPALLSEHKPDRCADEARPMG